MKWFLAVVVAAVVAAAFAYMQLNSVKTTYVNGLAPYTALPGREFILEQRLLCLQVQVARHDWPLLGSRDVVRICPAEVSAANVGADFPPVRILDVIHVGDHFRIASVRQDTGRAGTVITFEIVLDNESTRKYFKLDTYWMMDHSPEKEGAAPTYLTEYAVPEVME
jgi:hypothetical protein